MSTHNSLCSLENFKFHLVLIVTSFNQILQRLDKYIYIYQEIDWLYTLLKHRFHSSVVKPSGQVFNQLNRAVQNNLRGKGAKKIPSIAKKRLTRKKNKRHYLSSNQKFSRKLMVQSFRTEFEKFKIQNISLICWRLLIVLLIVMVRE